MTGHAEYMPAYLKAMGERIRFSPTDISISSLTGDDYALLSDFYCGVESIDDFFHNEVGLCSKYRYLTPYKCTLRSSGELAGLFTLANDLLSLEHEDKIAFPKLNSEYQDIFLRQTSYPSINIGHLAIRREFQSMGIGSMIIDFVKMTFTIYRKAGCQFITVDAINEPRTLRFYSDKSGFEFQAVWDVGHATRRMYLDIFTLPDD